MIAPVYSVYSLSVFLLILVLGKFLKFLQVEDAINQLNADDKKYVDVMKENSVIESEYEDVCHVEDELHDAKESVKFKRGTTFHTKVRHLKNKDISRLFLIYLVGISQFKILFKCCRTKKQEKFLEQYDIKKRKLKTELDLENWIKVMRKHEDLYKSINCHQDLEEDEFGSPQR